MFVAHSSISLQVTPSPLKPLLHVHLKLPRVFMQLALRLQFAMPSPHSFVSLQPSLPTAGPV